MLLEKYADDAGFMAYLDVLTPMSKKQKMAQVLPLRTRHVVTVIENVLDSNNTNAILRTSEALGIQEAHLVYGNIKYIPQKSVSKGAHLWIDTYKYGSEHEDNAMQCIKALKNKNYRLIVTTPEAQNRIEDITIHEPLAVCFGQESKGISQCFLNHADVLVSLPQYGFTESYNVAVAAGMIMMPLIERIRKSSISWQLTTEEQSVLYKSWILLCNEPIAAHYERYKQLTTG
jgi:tRNA (guanosine-2'-O-)-methyltransferase